MNEIVAGIICIKTDDGMMEIGPFVFDENLNDTFIKNKIHETLLEHDCDYYGVENVEDIIVVFASDDFEGLYSPKIEDVWPRDFGPAKFLRRKTKEGGEK